MAAENILGLTQNFLLPTSVEKFSAAIGESLEKTKLGLKSVIPALLLGIVTKAQTQNGAEVLVNLVHQDGIEEDKLPSETEDSYLDKGTDAVQGIFGNRLEGVVSSLENTTGIQNPGIYKMLIMAAPLVMGFLDTKMKHESLSTSGLMGFLDEPKTALKKIVSPDILQKISVPELRRPSYLPQEKSFIWMMLVLLMLGTLAGFWWFSGERILKNGKITQAVIGPVNPTSEPLVVPYFSPGDILTIDQMESFLQSGGAELPQIFRFETVQFEARSEKLIPGFEGELNLAAKALKKFPLITVRVEGHTDSIESEARSFEFSTLRAAKVMDQLIRRGIDPSRLESIGMGQSAPIATNSTEEGRALNQRIDLIITSYKNE